ncbi:ADP-ribose glycohydrolase ARH3-like isoform X2 [Anneissia japonica]|nr:ADP-ribose glycohydrolase ARH3-like isoform X2 [Anneissia japonica]
MAATACSKDLRSRFQGCLAAAVAGDCLGAPFEVSGVKSVEEVVKFEQQLSRYIEKELKAKHLEYTDDTAMARSVAQSLIDNKGKFNARDMAKRFHDEYLKESNRGYGGNVIDILGPLGDPELTDVFHPATTQFNGSGSYGNGGAMRVAPVGLAFYNNFEMMKQVAVDSARITHSNCLGYNGALLLSCAVYSALHIEAGTAVNSDQFIEKLIDIMKDVEAIDHTMQDSGDNQPKKSKLDESVADDPVYTRKLMAAQEFLKRDNVDNKEVVEVLGNGIAAQRSVVTAVYCFLRSVKSIETIPTQNGLVRTILYAISMNGDTDTIATMAGAIGGAYYGLESMPEKWREVCEGVGDAIKQGDELFKLNVGN